MWTACCRGYGARIQDLSLLWATIKSVHFAGNIRFCRARAGRISRIDHSAIIAGSVTLQTCGLPKAA